MWMLRYLLPSILILAASTLAGRYLLLSGNLRATLWLAFILSMLGTASIFLGMYWPSLYQFYQVQLERDRQVGFFANANDAGMAVVAAAALGFACLSITKRRTLVIAGIAAAGVAVILTYSRSSIMAYGLVALSQVFVSKITRNKTVIFASAVVVGGLLWFFLVGVNAMALSRDQQHRLSSITDLLHGKSDSSVLGGRKELAMAGVRDWLKSPILGNGLTSQIHNEETGVGSHNTLVRILGESGIVPGGLFVLFFAVFAWEAWRCRIVPVRIAAFGCCIAFLMNAAASHGAVFDKNYNVILGVCFGLLAGVKELEHRGAFNSAPHVPVRSRRDAPRPLPTRHSPCETAP
jgi:O-antigen ligase